jgi:hypothetical protein
LFMLPTGRSIKPSTIFLTRASNCIKFTSFICLVMAEIRSVESSFAFSLFVASRYS